MDKKGTYRPWAFITGASSGIGRATALELCKAGYSILAVARRSDRLAELKSEVESLGGECRSLLMDIRDSQSIERALQSHKEALEGLEVIVNNAGLAKGVEKVQDAKVEDWQTMMDTNVMGLLYITRALLPYILKNPKGIIVNLGSVAGRWVYPGGAVYCASKFAVRAFTEGLRMDLLGSQVRVTNIEPGMVETEFSIVRLGEKEKADAVYQGMKPLLAQDIAETILWIVKRPAHINIQELVIFPTDQAAVGQVSRRNS
jgi:3-hydroxy acid dehydrogenase / malonic semialdehyde reductase